MKRFSSRATDLNFSERRSATGDAPLADEPASPEVLGRLPTVLIIESNPVVRNLMRDIFSRKGFMVLDAVSHSEGVHLLQVLEQEKIDLVIVEHGVNSAAESFARHAVNLRPAMKILFTFGEETVASSLEHIVMSGSAFLRRPFTEARLLEIVSGLLDPTTQ